LESAEEDWCVAYITFLPVRILTLIAAEGNPDEEKIGAFGVGELSIRTKLLLDAQTSLGFYSLFSVTEEPFVSPGGMALS